MTEQTWRKTAYVSKSESVTVAMHGKWAVYVDTKGKGPVCVDGPFNTKREAEEARDRFASK